ncbi:2-amino-4-hydroxy-6-hydroxymethyldihydropteridine diphosphokinase [Glaciimonas sp. PCH181]|nr:2-amino-4-hydroxy-6-hydroxymethyldihydropteridine diphosphokinase [Glaciimonas sp. PCH181]
MCANVVAYIGVGGNLGDARAQVENAIVQLGALPHTKLSAQSSLFRTAPIESSGDDYVNAVVRIDTQLDPHALLQALQDVEHNFGRERPYLNAPRTLDLDLLLYGTTTIADATLTVPHPRMVQRAFVLIPLLQIDPFIAIPGLGPAHQFVPQVTDQAIAKI